MSREFCSHRIWIKVSCFAKHTIFRICCVGLNDVLMLGRLIKRLKRSVILFLRSVLFFSWCSWLFLVDVVFDLFLFTDVHWLGRLPPDVLVPSIGSVFRKYMWLGRREFWEFLVFVPNLWRWRFSENVMAMCPNETNPTLTKKNRKS